jgi:hypothetical protein
LSVEFVRWKLLCGCATFTSMPGDASLKTFLATSQLADLGPGPRPGVLSEALLNAQFRDDNSLSKLPPENQELVRALILLWHDHLEAAHAIAQGVESADAAFVHGIMHRREPDYGNATYWFRRVGNHPAFAQLSRRAAALLNGAADQELRRRLLPKGQWDPFGFINACEQVAGRPQGDAEQSRLLEVQALEFDVLLEKITE